MEKVLRLIFGENSMNELLQKIKNNSIIEDEDIGYDDYMTLLGQIEDFKIGLNANSINDMN